MTDKINKKLVLVFSISAFNCISCSDNSYSDLTALDLNGSVREIYTEEYEAIQENNTIMLGDLKDAKKITFNKDGNVLENIDFDTNMEVYQKVLNTYNSDGKKLQSDVINEGALLVNWMFSHEPSERKTNVKVYDKKGILFKEDHLVFDESGRITEEKNYRNDRDWFFYKKYSYDKDGNLIEKKVLVKGEVITKEEYFFENRKIEKNVYNPNNKLILKYIEIIDENRNPIESKKFGNGRLSDNNELMLLDSTKYEYQYDNKKNWIKRVQLNKHAEAVKITVRRISYY